jgi:asparagine synthase (glutamine-hydrolysing)
MRQTTLGGVREQLAEGNSWSCPGQESNLFIQSCGPGWRLFTWDSLAILLRGYVRSSRSGGAIDLDRVIEELRCHYLEHGELPLDTLEGSFTLALLDAQASCVVLYRNLVGAGFTYYWTTPNSLLFSSNLMHLVEESGQEPCSNQEVLPTFFLYRFVSGSDTLFKGFHRLLPGEMIRWDRRGLTRQQQQTFANLTEERKVGSEALDRLEETMKAVLADCAVLQPQAANLLSGGVDSSYLQAIWSRVALEDPLPPSVSLSVDHPHTWPDTDYAVTASQVLGTRHTLVPADDPYASYLLETLALTGEPPNHVQSAYFGCLARSMAGLGLRTGICGEGADSLFGLGLANQIHNAELLRKLAPTKPVRAAAALLAGLLGSPRLRSTFRLANGLGSLEDLEHPVNQIAAFTDWKAVRECFGNEAVARAAAGRRFLLDRYAVPDDPMDRLHAAGFLGEAMDSASLWTTLFNVFGSDLLCPFLDSRVLRLSLSLDPSVRFPFRKPKDLLKRALARLGLADLAQRPKLGFGQPIFEWLAPGGQLTPLVDQIGQYDFVPPATLSRARERPTWFLYSLLCYDLWHKLFIDRSLPRPSPSGLRESRLHRKPEGERV